MLAMSRWRARSGCRPTILSSGNVNMNQPYVVGQSGTDSPEPVLVTRPPAKIRTAVEAATSTAKRWRRIAWIEGYSLNVNGRPSFPWRRW